MAKLKTLSVVLLALGSAGGCASTVDEIRNAGREPELTPIQDPTFDATGRRQVVIPQPPRQVTGAAANSLWQADQRHLFADPRASRIGDIITVEIEIDDRAQFNNSSSRNRSSETQGGVTNFFGLENLPGQVLPQGFDPARMVGVSGEGTFSGTGAIQRNERVQLVVAGMVTQILPNGNLVVAGRQEVRVNNEVRELLVSGIVRPQDITATNTVRHTQMAEARIAYGGRGQLTAYQRPPVGQSVIEAISPF
jgi:flagellar L-ring protein FlgH